MNMRRVQFAASLLVFSAAAQNGLVNNVRALIGLHNLAAAGQEARAYQSRIGATPELAAALSWLARGTLDARSFDQADAYATEARGMALGFLKNRKLDQDPWLPTALGASIEVHAQAMAARGERPEAVAFLREQLKLFAATSLAERIRKNINLLNLEGKPAPPLEAPEWLGPKPPPLASLRGHPVLLFFWAHWCPDCKAEVPIIASLKKTFARQGLAIIGPTRYYGYVAGGEDAAPAVEKRYTELVRSQFYAALSAMPAPISAANFVTYGASTTPTLVLIDGAGLVRYYHPGAASEAELSARIRAILKN
ncbi:MAG TPA: TlpA disulfide reductase family protein [Candidatus Acidoferrales bacterium]|jgi:thiol-disulfide isomerase/thioredoxin|nr:TlpA disulfide reductase family protein [Candidatus Acidoferrales bacterium]